MASNKDDLGKGPSRPGDMPGGKRPYATIDVKAREVEGWDKPRPSAAANPAEAVAAGEKPQAPPSAPRAPSGRKSSLRTKAAVAASVGAALAKRVGSLGFLTHLAAGASGALLVLVATQLSASLTPELGELKRQLGELEGNARQGAAAAVGVRVEELSRAVAMLGEAQQGLAREIKALAGKVTAGVDATQGLRERVGKLEARATEPPIANQSGEQPELATFAARLGELEKSQHDASEAVKSAVGRFDADFAFLRGDAGRLAQRLDALRGEAEARLKGAAQAADVAPLALKLAAMERDLKALVGSEAERTRDTSRLVVGLELANLKRAVDRGEGYAGELTRLKRMAGNSLDLAPLEHSMQEGVPTLQALAKSFGAVADAMLDAQEERADATFLDRLLAGARSIVRVRRTGHAPSDDSAEAVIGRMQRALSDGRLADVLGHAKQLPPKAELAGEDWIRKAQRRQAVDQALADIEAALQASLAGQAAKPEAGR